MDELFQELENELKRLRPRAPSVLLIAEIEAELSRDSMAEPRAIASGEATGAHFGSWLNWRIAVAAAAALAVAAFLLTARPSAPRDVVSPPTVAVEAPPVSEPSVVSDRVVSIAPDNHYRPIGAASVLYDFREDGSVTLPNTATFRRVRYRYVDTYTWENPATHASLKWSLPRDEVRVLPASLH